MPSTYWKFLILEGDSSGLQWGQDLSELWLFLKSTQVWVLFECVFFLSFYIHEYSTPGHKIRPFVVFFSKHIVCGLTLCAHIFCICTWHSESVLEWALHACCAEMHLRPAVKVGEFKQAPPLGSCSWDSYKQDLRKCCAAMHGQPSA